MVNFNNIVPTKVLLILLQTYLKKINIAVSATELLNIKIKDHQLLKKTVNDNMTRINI